MHRVPFTSSHRCRKESLGANINQSTRPWPLSEYWTLSFGQRSRPRFPGESTNILCCCIIGIGKTAGFWNASMIRLDCLVFPSPVGSAMSGTAGFVAAATQQTSKRTRIVRGGQTFSSRRVKIPGTRLLKGSVSRMTSMHTRTTRHCGRVATRDYEKEYECLERRRGGAATSAWNLRGRIVTSCYFGSQ